MEKLFIIGFGNQAQAWALNLRDSGWDICIGLRSNSTSISKVQALGFEYIDIDKIENAKYFIILTPDESHYSIVSTLFKKNSEANFIYAHGYSLLYSPITKEFKTANHVLLAPKAIASELRFEFETKGSNAGVYSFEYLNSTHDQEIILNIAKGVGLNVLYEATVKDETLADLFSEQSLLCSMLPYASLYSYNLLREKGISKEVAFFECWHEVKLIANTMIKLGPKKFFNLISPNALMGSEIGHQALFNTEYRKILNDIYDSIESGHFAQDVETTNIKAVRNEILQFWEKEELTKLHEELQEKLYKVSQ